MSSPAGDSSSTMVVRVSPDDIGYISIAAAQKAGRKDLDRLNIKRIAL